MLQYYSSNREQLLCTKEVVARLTEAPTPLPEDIELIYDGRNKLYAIAGRNVVVKSFKVPCFLQRIVYSWLRPSKAKRSYDNAVELQHKQIGTAAPMGYALEYSGGLLRHSYYVSELLNDCSDLRAAMLGKADDPELYASFGRFVGHLHESGVYHKDLSPGNILYNLSKKNEYHFFLIDINRMKCYSHPLPDRLAYGNFARLSDQPWVSELLAKHYADYRKMERETCIKQIQAASDRFYCSKVYKYALRRLRSEGMSPWTFRIAYLQYRLLRIGRRFFGLPKQLFRKETELYRQYLRVGDVRGSLARRENYPNN
ncbi:lipopolysaccharide kinase InaA family protein [Porphyromonas crevioricanis]|uniref:3-deoxy-D-manno-octulosonic-acid kinase n=2 Tax=Porphyromonas crevioricanis TaxID=393921 RepID=A0A2X4SGE2_9PORP|nr:lipopolysaccharide kinase InaA family protein [Porphyromonas crevioricanis]GAD04548.1 hypothetical protein PORCRE_236 [Porphyromonas crevioricanis JCM 15906]GAD08242.1 hypothetical protein PORCAN_1878 [Porphyromonas crevioricanis JCM 13913]SJZ83989.1 Lipopolysaccharide kinase (Kdo/WaaP) family protein [Porphyromonas crevioricanis]SQH73082.1 3-deoxy-D-manno-octulosonic-acid kinase [Porphyromonas crevioricanis]